MKTLIDPTAATDAHWRVNPATAGQICIDQVLQQPGKPEGERGELLPRHEPKAGAVK